MIKEQIIKMRQTWDWPALRGYFSLPDPYTALLELIDNSIHAKAREIRIVVNIKDDYCKIIDCKGLGMGKRALEMDFLHWGREEPVGVTRFFGVGGKGAMGYLAHDVFIRCTPVFKKATYELNLPDFQERTLKGDVEVSVKKITPSPFQVPTVSIILRRLRVRVHIGKLKKRISSRYGPYLKSGRVKIWVKRKEDEVGELIRAQELPMEPYKEIKRPIVYPGGKGLIRGIIGLKSPQALIKGGIRCYAGTIGRLIVEHETFGLDERKDVNVDSIIGWVDNDFVPFTVNKDDFQRGTPQWEEFSRVMVEELEPLAEMVKREVRVPMEIEKAVPQIEKELNKLLQGAEEELTAQGERTRETKPVSAILLEVAKKKVVKKGEIEHPTPPGDEDRGPRPRKGAIRLHLDSHADASIRSWHEVSDSGVYHIYVNTEFAAMKATYHESKRTRSTDIYIIESALMEYYGETAGSVDEYSRKINAVLARVREK